MNILMENGIPTISQLLQELLSQEPIVGASDSHAKILVSQESKEDLKETEVHSFSELCTFLKNFRKQINPNGCSLKMLKTLLAYTGDSILDGYSLKWQKGGTMRNGESSTLKTMEFPKTESECSLSDILEQEVDEKYFLSEQATKRLLSYKHSDIKEDTISPTLKVGGSNTGGAYPIERERENRDTSSERVSQGISVSTRNDEEVRSIETAHCLSATDWKGIRQQRTNAVKTFEK